MDTDHERFRIHPAFEDSWARLNRVEMRHRELVAKTEEYFSVNRAKLLHRTEADGSILLTGSFPATYSGRVRFADRRDRGALAGLLDHASYSMAECAGTVDPHSSYFPFGSTEQDARDTLKNSSKEVPIAIHDLFLSFKPYRQGGDALLRALSELVRVSKHYFVAGSAMAIVGGDFLPPSTPQFSNRLTSHMGFAKERIGACAVSSGRPAEYVRLQRRTSSSFSRSIISNRYEACPSLRCFFNKAAR